MTKYPKKTLTCSMICKTPIDVARIIKLISSTRLVKDREGQVVSAHAQQMPWSNRDHPYNTIRQLALTIEDRF